MQAFRQAHPPFEVEGTGESFGRRRSDADSADTPTRRHAVRHECFELRGGKVFHELRQVGHEVAHLVLARFLDLLHQVRAPPNRVVGYGLEPEAIRLNGVLYEGQHLSLLLSSN